MALKIEYPKYIPTVIYEAARLHSLTLANNDHIPSVFSFGKHENSWFVAMEALGPSLSQLAHFCGGKLSLKTVLMIGKQMIQNLEELHQYGRCVHRDLKPDNIIVGL